MPDDEPAEPQNKGDKANSPSPFSLTTIFPDAQGIFDARHKTLAQVKDDCFVALDANVLLLPYRLEDVSLLDVVSTYKPLAEAGRLVIPAQAAREFAKHRAAKVAELARYLRDQASLSGPVLKKKIGALAKHEGYNSVKEKSESVAAQVKELQSAINDLADQIAADVGEDPVSSAYRDIFSKTVCENPPECEDEKSFSQELKERYEARRPPGYKDKAKPDTGAGDLIIWKTILAEGVKRKIDCIFVTGDEKSDWYVQSSGPFQPRLELIEEYRIATGRTLHVVPLSRLLKLYEASQQAVDDVRRVEDKSELTARQVNFLEATGRRREEYNAIQHELSSIAERIASAESSMADLPPYDGNMSLPWNKAHQLAETSLRDLISRRRLLEERLSDLAREL